jgi:hypothetical protein
MRVDERATRPHLARRFRIKKLKTPTFFACGAEEAGGTHLVNGSSLRPASVLNQRKAGLERGELGANK